MNRTTFLFTGDGKRRQKRRKRHQDHAEQAWNHESYAAQRRIIPDAGFDADARERLTTKIRDDGCCVGCDEVSSGGISAVHEHLDRCRPIAREGVLELRRDNERELNSATLQPLLDIPIIGKILCKLEVAALNETIDECPAVRGPVLVENPYGNVVHVERDRITKQK